MNNVDGQVNQCSVDAAHAAPVRCQQTDAAHSAPLTDVAHVTRAFADTPAGGIEYGGSWTHYRVLKKVSHRRTCQDLPHIHNTLVRIVICSGKHVRARRHPSGSSCVWRAFEEEQEEKAENLTFFS